MRYKQLWILANAAVFTLATSFANAAIDIAAPVVKLRTSCSEAGSVLNNCFTDMPSLTSWIWGTRKPSASAPLLVEIGPGTFSGSYDCSNSGYVTLRGSGPKQTKISASNPLSSANCTQLNFEDLTIEGSRSGSFTLVRWDGGGVSRWTNVDLITYGYGWLEGSCAATPGQHYWFGSRILAYSSSNSLRNYIANCDVSWFIGSEITSNSDTGSSFINTLKAGGSAAGHGEIHVYGSVIRAITGNNVNMGPVTSTGGGFNGFAAIVATNGGEIHIHGSAIDAESAAGNQIAVLAAHSGGIIHANTASYNIKTGAGGSVTRVLNQAGHIHAPYSWQPHPEAPFVAEGVSFTSQEGADTAVVTRTDDGFPHLVIYTEKCASKWFDIVTKACR